MEGPGELADDYDVDFQEQQQQHQESQEAEADLQQPSQDGQIVDATRAELDQIDEEDESYLESSLQSEQDISQGAGHRGGNAQLRNLNADLENQVIQLYNQVEILKASLESEQLKNITINDYV